MGANDAGMQRACAEGPSVHAPNPNQEEAFPLLVLDVRNGVNNPPRLGFKRMHWHSDLQFIVVSKGLANIDCAGRHFNCAKGCGAFFNSNVPHRIMSDAKTEYMSFIFPEKLLGFFQGSEMAAFGVSPFVGPHAQSTAHFDLAAPWHREVLNELVRARALLASKKATGVERYRACAHLLAAWSVYVLNVEQRIPTKAERATNERMKAFTLFIDANYNRDISLEDIAKAGNVSKAECARCFKKLTLRPHTKGETRTMIAKQGATIDGNGDKLANYLTMAPSRPSCRFLWWAAGTRTSRPPCSCSRRTSPRRSYSRCSDGWATNAPRPGSWRSACSWRDWEWPASATRKAIGTWWRRLRQAASAWPCSIRKAGGCPTSQRARAKATA